LSCVITIDGPTGSGKSTVSRMLAERLNYQYLDTGAMYRAVGLAIWRTGVDINKEKEVEKICKDLEINFVHDGTKIRTYLGDEDVTSTIREPIIDIMASDVSKLNAVRKIMSKLQKKIGTQGPLVAEGRDMGTVVFPEAKQKFYLDASLEVRVDRRFQERKKKGESISKNIVKQDLIKRDHQDMNRQISPLRPAKNAKVIDTTYLNPQQVVNKIINEMKKESWHQFSVAPKKSHAEKNKRPINSNKLNV
jgi:cytidylate kinase